LSIPGCRELCSAIFAGAALLLVAPPPASAETASLRLHPRVTAAFEQYRKRWNPMYFAISEDGLWAGYVTCDSSAWACRDSDGRKLAIKLCRELSQSRSSCRIFARGKKVVWKGRFEHASEAYLGDVLPPDETILRNFDRIAFFAEYQDQTRRHPLMRWHRPLRISLHGTATHRYQDQVARVAAELSEITGHDIALLEAGGDQRRSNVRVYFAEEIYRAAAGRYLGEVGEHLLGRVDVESSTQELDESGAICFALLADKADAPWEIARAVIFVPSGLSRSATRACVTEELAQVLGLINDSDEVQPSIFNDRSPFHRLTAHDRLLLRLLYDDQLKAGMSHEQAMPLVRRHLAAIAR